MMAETLGLLEAMCSRAAFVAGHTGDPWDNGYWQAIDDVVRVLKGGMPGGHWQRLAQTEAQASEAGGNRPA